MYVHICSILMSIDFLKCVYVFHSKSKDTVFIFPSFPFAARHDSLQNVAEFPHCLPMCMSFQPGQKLKNLHTFSSRRGVRRRALPPKTSSFKIKKKRNKGAKMLFVN